VDGFIHSLQRAKPDGTGAVRSLVVTRENEREEGGKAGNR